MVITHFIYQSNNHLRLRDHLYMDAIMSLKDYSLNRAVLNSSVTRDRRLRLKPALVLVKNVNIKVVGKGPGSVLLFPPETHSIGPFPRQK